MVSPLRISAPSACARPTMASIAGSASRKPPSGCTHRHVVRRHPKGGKPSHQFGRASGFRGATHAARLDASVPLTSTPSGGPISAMPVTWRSCRPAAALDLAPSRIGAAHQRHIGGMLEIAEPDDAGFPVRGAALMAGREALEAEHPHAAARRADRAPRCRSRRARRRRHRNGPYCQPASCRHRFLRCRISGRKAATSPLHSCAPCACSCGSPAV